jgi:RND family efflux transporter MFP subunit
MTSINNLYFLFGFLSLLCACGNADQSNAEDTINTKEKASDVRTVVTTGIVLKRSFQYLIKSNGKVGSLHEQDFKSEVSAKVLWSKASSGTTVAAGELIAKLEDSLTIFRLQKAKLALFNAEKEYSSQLLGYESLLKERNPSEAEQIRKKLRISTGLSAAEQEIKESTAAQRKSSLISPFRGVIADVNLQQGQQVQANQELLKLYDPDNLFLAIKVLESDINLMTKNTIAEVIPVSDRNAVYKAKVSDINPYVDDNGLIGVRLLINVRKQIGSGNLFPGMNCEATISIPVTNALVVPKSAIVLHDGGPVIFTIEHGKAKWNYVVTGKDNGQYIEILKGLTGGQKIITGNNLQLTHDTPVKEENN